MIVALIILISLIVTGIILYLHHRFFYSKKEIVIETQTSTPPEENCCGMHITCEKDSLLASISNEIVYYDDEELDIFAGRNENDYTDDEIEQFRDILLTLLPSDIAGWGRSIQLRGITLPTIVRDELLLIVAEARQNSTKIQD